MPETPADAILTEEAMAAGVAALERIHGGHLTAMSPEEQAEARAHWRAQVEQVLHAVAVTVAAPGGGRPGGGRAVLTFADGEEEGAVEVSAAFHPDLRDLGDGEVEGTPAQFLAITALQAIEEGVEEEEGFG